MDKKIAAALNESDPQLAWNLVKDIILLQLLGEIDAVAVPFLNEASSYDLFAVTVKNKNKLIDTMKGKKAHRRVVGDLRSLILDPQATAPPSNKGRRPVVHCEEKEDPWNFNPNYNYKFYDMYKGVSKSIEVNVKDCFKRELTFTGTQPLRIERAGQELQKAKRAYIIMVAFCASEIRIEVIVGGKKSQMLLQEPRIPFAFQQNKYYMDDNGFLTLKKAYMTTPREVTDRQSRLSLMLNRRGSTLSRASHVQADAGWDRRSSKRNPKDPLPAAPPAQGNEKAARRNPKDPLPAVPRNAEKTMTTYTTPEQRAKMPVPPIPKS